MALSPNVAKSSLKKEGEKKKGPGPFAGMNRTEAHVRESPPPRSKAAQRRSGDSEEKPKTESPLYKALKMQTALAPVSYSRRTAIKEKISQISTFDHFPLLPAVRDSIYSNALAGLLDVVPTPIQRVAIPSLLQKPSNKSKSKKVDDETPKYEQFLLAAETGSGKTLAYLIPLIDGLKRNEVIEKEQEQREEEKRAKEREQRLKDNVFQLEPEEPPLSNAGRPRIIVLVPTAELVEQVGAKVKAMSHTLKFRSGMISSAYSPKRIKNTLFRPDGIDVVVSTPYLLTSIAKKDPYILSRVNQLVLDEADSLLDRSFAPTTKEVISKTAPSLQRLVLCSATIPRSLDNFLRANYPDIKRLTTPNLHAIPRRVQMGVVDIEKTPYNGKRNLACADVIWSIGKGGESNEETGEMTSYMEKKAKRILVFVNERDDALEVTKYLVSQGIDAMSLAQETPQRQQEIIEEFSQWNLPPTPDQIMQAREERRANRWAERSIPFVEEPKTRDSYRKLSDTRVLVTTDRTSRGIDTMAVKTLILYDVPHTTIDFIHRLGRLGRMGKRGRAIVLVGKKDRKDVVREVREAMYRGTALI